jgi:hypothetical protein
MLDCGQSPGILGDASGQPHKVYGMHFLQRYDSVQDYANPWAGSHVLKQQKFGRDDGISIYFPLKTSCDIKCIKAEYIMGSSPWGPDARRPFTSTPIVPLVSDVYSRNYFVLRDAYYPVLVLDVVRCPQSKTAGESGNQMRYITHCILNGNARTGRTISPRDSGIVAVFFCIAVCRDLLLTPL